MSIAFDHREPGTPEREWQAAAPWEGVPSLPLDMSRLIVFAAHPDDETLGAGGLIASAAARGIPVSVVVATDGEASHPGSDAAYDLRRERRGEVVDALADLAPGCRLSFLGLPDGSLRESGDALRRAVGTVLSSAAGDRTTIAAPWWGDGHRDHRVLGEIVRELGQGAGAGVVGYPIWFWHWAQPASVDPGSWRMLPLDVEARSAKARALRRHASQVTRLSDRAGDEEILHEGMLAHFRRAFEVFIDAAARPSVSAEPVFFDDKYARRDDPWGVDSRWYERRKRELLLASLPRERFESVLDIGCGTGTLTRRLAERAGRVVGVDASEHAIETARERLRGVPRARVDLLDVRRDWPAGRFDLVVLSELAYYWTAADLVSVLDRIDESLADDGVLVACHWRHAIAEAPLSGDGVHAAIGARPELRVLARHVEEDFVLEVFARHGHDESVARATGVVS